MVYLQLNRSKRNGTVPLDVRRSMEQEPEVLALGQQHGDERRTPESDEEEFREDAEKVDQVRGKRAGECEVAFEDVGDGE